jgi:hypothetical protein
MFLFVKLQVMVFESRIAMDIIYIAGGRSWNSNQVCGMF